MTMEQVVVFDTRSGRISWAFDKEIHGAQVSDVIISTGGVAAGAYEKHLLIRDLSSVSSIENTSISLSHSYTEEKESPRSTSKKG